MFSPNLRTPSCQNHHVKKRNSFDSRAFFLYFSWNVTFQLSPSQSHSGRHFVNQLFVSNHSRLLPIYRPHFPLFPSSLLFISNDLWDRDVITDGESLDPLNAGQETRESYHTDTYTIEREKDIHNPTITNLPRNLCGFFFFLKDHRFFSCLISGWERWWNSNF